MKKFATLTVTTALMVACSSMSFMPPQYSLATTAYVDQSVNQNLEQALQEITAKTEQMMTEMKTEVDQIKGDIETQTADVKAALASVEEINSTAARIQAVAKKSKEEVRDVQREVMDSLDVLTHRLDKQLEVLHLNLKALEAQDAQFENLTKSMQGEIEAMPQETLFELRQAIDAYYKKAQ